MLTHQPLNDFQRINASTILNDSPPIHLRIVDTGTPPAVGWGHCRKLTNVQVSIEYDSQTITHATNVTGEIGTFCETTGDIYTGYGTVTDSSGNVHTNTGPTDCICQVAQTNELSSRVVGIICGTDKFASHGDVLVKVVPGEYNLGDILAPDTSGYARIATNEEKMFMMLNAIPRPKITGLETNMDNMVACFLL